jgi:hypothetical protein
LAKFNGVAASSMAGAGPATSLTLTFDKDIAGLDANDITITAGSAGTVKEGLTSTATGTYAFKVGGVKASGKITVKASKNGYRIDPDSHDVNVLYIPAELPPETLRKISGGGKNFKNRSFWLSFYDYASAYCLNLSNGIVDTALVMLYLGRAPEFASFKSAPLV